MTRKLTLVSAALLISAFVAAVGIFAVSKPYQQDRILITLGLKS